MARVVQQRGTPPYLLILVVVLFLVSTALAVLFYTRYDEKTRELAATEEALSEKARQLSQEKQAKLRLIKSITGREGQDVTDKVAQTEAELAMQSPHAQAYKTEGLAAAVKALDDRIGDPRSRGHLQEIAVLTARVNDLNEVIRSKDRTIKDREDRIDQLGRQSNQKLSAARDDFNSNLQAKDDQLDRALREQKAIITDKDRQITVQAQDLAQAREETGQRDRQIDRLLELVRELKGPRVDAGEAMMREPDGKIAKVLMDQTIVYINIGEKDRVTPGLPFSVYSSQTGIPAEGEGKAQLVVNNVFPTTSECRIVKASKDDPMIEGDLIANVVFDATRTYNFVVEGEFDLYAEGRADPLANRRVRTMIERFGGNVVDGVSVDTDFVVLGYEPPRPDKPGTDAQPTDWEQYKRKVGKYDYFTNIKATAVALQIPILNTNRFLAFTGLVPKKRLTE